MLLSSSSHVFVFSSHIIILNRIPPRLDSNIQKVAVLADTFIILKLPLESVRRTDELVFMCAYVRLYYFTNSVSTDCIDSHKRY